MSEVLPWAGVAGTMTLCILAAFFCEKSEITVAKCGNFGFCCSVLCISASSWLWSISDIFRFFVGSVKLLALLNLVELG